MEASEASRLDPGENASACRVGSGHIRRPPDAPLKHSTRETYLRFQRVRALNMLPQPFAASSLFAATSHFAVSIDEILSRSVKE